MSVTAVNTWVSDIGQFGPIYPFVGTEFVLFIAGMAFWIAFHVLQGKIENQELQEESDALAQPGRMQEALSARDHQDRF